MKILCSYEGKILPRYPDGKLRYHGGETRVLAVDRFISFSELLSKLGEFYGPSVTLRCQLPKEDLDALVSIRSDEDLKNMVEEYDLASQAAGAPLKIRAFLWRPKSVKKILPRPCAASPVVKYRNSKKLSDQTVGSGFTANPSLIQMVPTPTALGFPLCFEQQMRIRKCYYTRVSHGSLRYNGKIVI